MHNPAPSDELYVLRLLQSSSCFKQDYAVCGSPPCACAQSLLDGVGKPLLARAEAAESRAKAAEDALVTLARMAGDLARLREDK